MQRTWWSKKVDYEISVHAVNGWLDALSTLQIESASTFCASTPERGAVLSNPISAHANTAKACFHERIDTVSYQTECNDTK
jgi:hypothetical protein